MSDISGYLASAIETESDEPVCLTGTSTGGSVVLQLAVDRPELVRALVVVAAAYKLGPRGRELFEQTAAGVQNGRSHIYPDRGQMRTSASDRRRVPLPLTLAGRAATVILAVIAGGELMRCPRTKRRALHVLLPPCGWPSHHTPRCV
jgi:pimeloyl-ACP methyl ester carboxylesterase